MGDEAVSLVKHVPGSCTNSTLALDFNTKVSL